MKVSLRGGRAMGSPLRLTLAGARGAEADAAWAIVRVVFDEVERRLTRFDPDSDLSRLNRAAGREWQVSPLLARAVAAAWRAFRRTGGRFDPRIVGALEAAGERAGVALPPSPRHLGPADRWLTLDPRRRVARIEAPIDLGGIGKGLALRWAAARLRRAGHHDLLLHAGGDLVALGRGPGNRPWVVALEDPTGGPRPLTTIDLHDAALATSSVALRRWVGRDGTWRHHLIDPRTLAPATPTWLSVTVRDLDPAWAEVWSKAALLAGTGIGAVTRRRAAWWVAPDGALRASPTARRPGARSALDGRGGWP